MTLDLPIGPIVELIEQFGRCLEHPVGGLAPGAVHNMEKVWQWCWLWMKRRHGQGLRGIPQCLGVLCRRLRLFKDQTSHFASNVSFGLPLAHGRSDDLHGGVVGKTGDRVDPVSDGRVRGGRIDTEESQGVTGGGGGCDHGRRGRRGQGHALARGGEMMPPGLVVLLFG